MEADSQRLSRDVGERVAGVDATKIATRPDSTGRRSYGSYRAEVFASGLTVLLMLGVSAYVVVEGISRIGTTVDVQTGPMLIVGAIGLGINVISMLLLRGGAQESLNVKGAYFEVVADAAGSVGVIVAGWLVLVTGNEVWDTVVALAIGAFVAVRAVSLRRQVLSALGQQVPEGMGLETISSDLRPRRGPRWTTSYRASAPSACTPTCREVSGSSVTSAPGW